MNEVKLIGGPMVEEIRVRFGQPLNSGEAEDVREFLEGMKASELDADLIAGMKEEIEGYAESIDEKEEEIAALEERVHRVDAILGSLEKELAEFKRSLLLPIVRGRIAAIKVALELDDGARCTMCGPGHAGKDGKCLRHGKRVRTP
jgi:predicted house-cleaning noncanonical NTP pyrophosphatase (MazG superfamily)